jgi:hypothetical protein
VDDRRSGLVRRMDRLVACSAHSLAKEPVAAAKHSQPPTNSAGMGVAWLLGPFSGLLGHVVLEGYLLALS